MAIQTSLELKAFYQKFEAEKPDVIEWCKLYNIFVHQLDDVIDEPKDVERTCRVFSCARRLWTHPVYLKWRHVLDVVDELANSAYLDAEVWKTSPEEWKRHHADVLRHQGYNVFYAIVYLEFGRPTLREISLKIREDSLQPTARTIQGRLPGLHQ